MAEETRKRKREDDSFREGEFKTPPLKRTKKQPLSSADIANVLREVEEKRMMKAEKRRVIESAHARFIKASKERKSIHFQVLPKSPPPNKADVLAASATFFRGARIVHSGDAPSTRERANQGLRRVYKEAQKLADKSVGSEHDKAEKIEKAILGLAEKNPSLGALFTPPSSQENIATQRSSTPPTPRVEGVDDEDAVSDAPSAVLVQNDKSDASSDDAPRIGMSL